MSEEQKSEEQKNILDKLEKIENLLNRLVESDKVQQKDILKLSYVFAMIGFSLLLTLLALGIVAFFEQFLSSCQANNVIIYYFITCVVASIIVFIATVYFLYCVIKKYVELCKEE